MTAVALRDVVEVAGGGTPRKSTSAYYGAGIPWVTPKDMKRPLIGDSEVTLTEDGVRNSPAKLVPEGSVLVVVRSGVLKHTLPVALTTRPVTVNQDMKALTPHRELDPSYLARMLKALQPKVLSWVRATTADNFPINSLLDLEVELPPLPEQRRIAAILDHADALRAKRRQVLTHLETLTRSTFRADFVDVAETSRLGDLATTTSGGTPNRSISSNYGGGIPWVKSGELHAGLVTATEETISSQGLSSSSAKVFPTGTVLLAMYGATAGVVGRLGLDAATNQAICAITPGPLLDAEYLIAALRSQTVQLVAKATGGAQPNLSQGIIRDIVIPVPSLDDQNRFASKVAAIDAQRSDAIRVQAMDGDLFASLQSRAFRGEL